MGDDFEAGAGNSPGGPGPSGPGVGLSRRYGTMEEKMQDMRRHLREQEDRHKKAEKLKKAREKEMAAKWLEHERAKKSAREEEVRERLTQLARQKQHTERKTLEKKAHQAEARAAARATIPDGGSTTCSGLPGVRSEAEATAAAETAGGSAATATVGVAEHNQNTNRPGEPDHPSSSKTAPRTSPGRSGGISSLRTRKKKREEAATPRGITVPQREKSIMQEVQEMCPGLNKSTDGREILAAGTRNEKQRREAMVRGDPIALQEVEREANEMSTEEEQEAEVQEQPTISNRHMARRYRLRMMHQITSQVLQCRKKMALNFQQSLPSARGLGCSPHVDPDVPRSPMNCKWIPD